MPNTNLHNSPQNLLLASLPGLPNLYKWHHPPPKSTNSKQRSNSSPSITPQSHIPTKPSSAQPMRLTGFDLCVSIVVQVLPFLPRQLWHPFEWGHSSSIFHQTTPRSFANESGHVALSSSTSHPNLIFLTGSTTLIEWKVVSWPLSASLFAQPSFLGFQLLPPCRSPKLSVP